MTDDAPDKEKRSHGALWYVCWALVVYVGSFVPVLVVTARLVARYGDPIDSPTIAALRAFYLPLYWLIAELGLSEQFFTLILRLIRWKP